MKEFKALGRKVEGPIRDLDIFATPASVRRIVLETSGTTSLCTVTGKMNTHQVSIEYAPEQTCIETKSLKLYLDSYSEVGIFCESLADQIARDVYEACQPRWCMVVVTQGPRGGITITTEAIEGAYDLDTK